MKYCISCGKEINDDAVYCPECETAKAAEQVFTPVEKTAPAQTAEPQDEETGPWRAFAIIGLVLGIISLIFSWLPFSIFYMSGFGITFSAMGLNSKSKKGQGSAGLVLSIISAVLNIIFTIVIIVLAATAATGAFGDVFGDLFYDLFDF